MNNRMAHKNKWKCWLAGTAFVVFGSVANTVNAATQIDDFEAMAARNDFRQLDVDELGELRGRYVQGNNVLLFGMEMSTVWTSPSGDAFTTRANLQIDLSGAKPSVTFTPHVTVTPGDASQNHMVAGAGSNIFVVDHGTSNAKGVVQVIQAGGDGITAGNNFALNINHGGNFDSDKNNGQTARSHASGAQMSIQSGAGGLSMSIHVPGQGEVTQGIYAGRGLHQSIQLTGSGLNVHNEARMQVQMNREMRSAASTRELRSSLHSIRALERTF